MVALRFISTNVLFFTSFRQFPQTTIYFSGQSKWRETVTNVLLVTIIGDPSSLAQQENTQV
jgi:hypothetical protein